MTPNVSCVFVCTGNMCRSPFAEHVFRTLGPPWVESSSAGLMALPGGTATPASVRAAKRLDIDLSSHRTRSLDENVLRQASGIYVFERRHRDNLEALFPDIAPKLHLLGTLVGAKDGEIPDPVSGPESGIVRCYETIQQACTVLAREFRKVAPKG